MSLIQNYQIQTPVELEAHDDHTEWTTVGSGAGGSKNPLSARTIATSTVLSIGDPYRFGQSQVCIQPSFNAGGTYCHLTKTGTWDLSSCTTFGFYHGLLVNTTGDRARVGRIRLILITDDAPGNPGAADGTTGLTDYAHATVTIGTNGAEQIFSGEWHWSHFSKGDFTIGGSFDWADVKAIRWEIWGSTGTTGTLNAGPAPGTAGPEITFGPLYGNVYSRPKIMIVFDDGAEGVESRGKAAMDVYGWKGACFVLMGLSSNPRGYREGGASYMGVDELDTLYAAGWDIGHHACESGDTLNTLTDAVLAEEFATQYADFQTLGWTRGIDWGAWPEGVATQAQMSILKNLGLNYSFDTGRGYPNHQFGVSGISAPLLNMRRWAVDADDTTETVENIVKEGIKRGGLTCLGYHNITASGATGSNRDLADLEADLAMIARYVEGNQADIVTPSQWLSGMTQVRRTR
jgi:hypothetical protein